MNCIQCGRPCWESCGCGITVPSRQCPTHKTPLIIVNYPTLKGNGTPDDPIKITNWNKLLSCQNETCGYRRAFKNPSGSRNANRKQGEKENDPIAAATRYFRCVRNNVSTLNRQQRRSDHATSQSYFCDSCCTESQTPEYCGRCGRTLGYV